MMMTEKFWKITEVIERFQVDREFLIDLEEEEIVCPICREQSKEKLFSPRDLENLRLAKILFEEMDVNLPGIEVILQMRKNMLDMRKQFDAILEDLASRLREKLEDEL
jgi:MerR family transcriptional regulator/heat shock protein HspR